MPEDLVDDWEASPRRETGRGARTALLRALERWVPHVIGPALVTASLMLLAGQLFSSYRTLWPANLPGRFQLETDSMSIKLAYVIASPSPAAPLVLTSLPVVAFAGLIHLPLRSRPPVAPRLRLVARAIALVVTLVGVVVLIATVAWTLVTHGVVGIPNGRNEFFSEDPVTTVLSRGGDGLATAALAGVASWLLWTRSAAVVTAAPESAAVAPREEAQSTLGDEAATIPTRLSEDSGPAALADPAYRLGSVVAGSPAPFVTRGASEPSWQHTDPTVFRRPSAGSDLGPEPDDAEPVATDPALLFRRPVR